MLPTLFPFHPLPRRAAVLATVLASLVCCAPVRAADTTPLIDSGVTWFDTDGHPIDAHGGGLLAHEGVFYWYGEIKSGETILPASNADWGGTRVPFTGVSCYASTDLVHWRNLGNALPADANVPELEAGRVVERPKVIFNRSTNTFVMWMHIDSANYQEAKTGVAVAVSPAGPFRYLGSVRPNAGVFPGDMPESLRHEFSTASDDPLLEAWSTKHPEWRVWARDFKSGQMARDMALFVDEDGAAYQFYASEENAVLHVSRLTDDYVHHAGRYRRITFDSREAPAPFKWNGRYYVVTSGCTGWDPNTARIHSTDSIFGPWTDHGSFFAEDSAAARVSYLSQPAYVAVLDKAHVLFLADRWNKNDLQHSRYVWLPVDLTRDVPRVNWLQVWDINRFRAR
jgi:hypothetical protein